MEGVIVSTTCNRVCKKYGTQNYLQYFRASKSSSDHNVGSVEEEWEWEPEQSELKLLE